MNKLDSLCKFSCVIALSLPGYAMAGSNWDGKYVGASIGYADVDADVDSRVVDVSGAYFIGTDAGQVGPQASPTLSDSNINGSFILGYNKRNGDQVLGIEADLSFMNYKDKSSSGSIEYLTFAGGFFTSETTVEADWMASLRGRIGILRNSTLFYVTGGVALAQVEYEHTFSDTVAPAFSRASGSKTALGWTAGVGAEWQLQDNWSVKAEYLYSRFNDAIDDDSVLRHAPNEGFKNSGDLEVQNFRIGLNYAF